jgi:hypothetical protein
MIRPTRISLVVALALVGQLACTNAAVDKAVGSTNGGVSTIVATRTEKGVEIENRAGRPLLNVRIEIERGDNTAPFVYVLPTLDTGGKHEVAFTEFRADDGTLMDSGSAAGKKIKTTARDTLNNSYEVTTP